MREEQQQKQHHQLVVVEGVQGGGFIKIVVRQRQITRPGDGRTDGED